jgi:hypothetical protein
LRTPKILLMSPRPAQTPTYREGLAPSRRIPLGLKVFHALMVGAIVPIYWREYGPENFLWFSDIALLLMLPALWLESSLLASMMAVGALFLEIAWVIDFFSGARLLGLADYMFGAGNLPMYLRVLSGFHFFLPPIIIFALARLGYDRRAFWAQTALAVAVLPLSYCFADAEKNNINWTLGFGGVQETFPPLVWVGVLMIGLPLLVYAPMDALLRKIFRDPNAPLKAPDSGEKRL